jgi:hypothetical protein
MHDQSASRTNGRTLTPVSAMCVHALRMTVLKSAGYFTRGECHDLNAEKIQLVKCFMFRRRANSLRWQFFECRRGRPGSKISDYGRLAEVAVHVAMSDNPRKQTALGRNGVSAGIKNAAWPGGQFLAQTDLQSDRRVSGGPLAGHAARYAKSGDVQGRCLVAGAHPDMLPCRSPPDRSILGSCSPPTNGRFG